MDNEKPKPEYRKPHLGLPSKTTPEDANFEIIKEALRLKKIADQNPRSGLPVSELQKDKVYHCLLSGHNVLIRRINDRLAMGLIFDHQSYGYKVVDIYDGQLLPIQ